MGREGSGFAGGIVVPTLWLASRNAVEAGRGILVSSVEGGQREKRVQVLGGWNRCPTPGS